MGLGMLLHMENLEEPRNPRRGARCAPLHLEARKAQVIRAQMFLRSGFLPFENQEVFTWYRKKCGPWAPTVR